MQQQIKAHKMPISVRQRLARALTANYTLNPFNMAKRVYGFCANVCNSEKAAALNLGQSAEAIQVQFQFRLRSRQKEEELKTRKLYKFILLYHIQIELVIFDRYL